MVAIQVADRTYTSMVGDSSDESPVRTVADRNRLYMINMDDSDNTGEKSETGSSSGMEEFHQSLLMQQEGGGSAHNSAGRKRSLEKKVSFNVPTMPNSFMAKKKRGTKGARRKQKRTTSKHSPEKDSHKHSRRKIYSLQRENKKLKQENKYLRSVLREFALQKVSKEKEEKKLKGGSKTSDLPPRHEKAKSSNVGNERKVRDSSKRRDSDDTEETAEVPLQLMSNGKVSFLPSFLLSQSGRPRGRENDTVGNDTVTTAAIESECSSEVVRNTEPAREYPSGKGSSSRLLQGDKISTIEEVTSSKRNLSSIRSYSFDCPDGQLDEKHQKAAVCLLKGTMEKIISLTLDLEVAKEELNALKKTHTTELKGLEEKRLGEVKLLQIEVAHLQDIVETMKRNSSTIEKRLEDFESDQTKKQLFSDEEHEKEKREIVEHQSEETKEYQKQLSVLNASLKKQEKLQEAHEQEKKDMAERHAKETEEYKHQLGTLKRAVTKLVKKRSSNFNANQSMRSVGTDQETSQLIMQYEKKIQDMDEQHSKEVKQLRKGSMRLKKMLMNMEKQSVRMEAGYTPKSSQQGF